MNIPAIRQLPGRHFVRVLCLLAGALLALGIECAQAADAGDDTGALNLGQGLHIGPVSRPRLSDDAIAGPLPAPAPQINPLSPVGEHRSPFGLSLYRNGTLLDGDRLSFSMSGATTASDTLGLLGSGVGVSANPLQVQGLRGGSYAYTSELTYLTPVGRNSGIGLSLQQRSGNLRDYGINEERMLSLRFSSRF